MAKRPITVRKVAGIGWAVFKKGKQVSSVTGKAMAHSRAAKKRK